MVSDHEDGGGVEWNAIELKIGMRIFEI